MEGMGHGEQSVLKGKMHSSEFISALLGEVDQFQATEGLNGDAVAKRIVLAEFTVDPWLK